MSIITKITEWVKKYQHELYLGTCAFLIAVIAYNLGYSQAFKKSPIDIYQNAEIYDALNSENGNPVNSNPIKVQPTKTDFRVVASKSAGSKLYHFTWCSGAKRIKDANKIWFETEAAAIAAGYSLAGNCQK